MAGYTAGHVPCLMCMRIVVQGDRLPIGKLPHHGGFRVASQTLRWIVVRICGAGLRCGRICSGRSRRILSCLRGSGGQVQKEALSKQEDEDGDSERNNGDGLEVFGHRYATGLSLPAE